MAKISVITPTVRVPGLDLVKRALESQTFRDFEWLIISPKKIFLDFPSRILQDPPKQKGDVWTLNKAYNKAVREARGELIVSWQDYTFAGPEALEKFWQRYLANPKALVSGVGNKYSQVWPKLGRLVWQDPRERDDLGGLLECSPAHIEANFCAIPKKAFFVVGGFDEYLDKYFGLDAFSVFDRLGILGGWRFFLDQTNKSYSLPHQRLKNWEERNALFGPYQQRRQIYLINPVLEYLK